jgi:DNA ligase-associated metallophosphoesterase
VWGKLLNANCTHPLRLGASGLAHVGWRISTGEPVMEQFERTALCTTAKHAVSCASAGRARCATCVAAMTEPAASKPALPDLAMSNPAASNPAEPNSAEPNPAQPDPAEPSFAHADRAAGTDQVLDLSGTRLVLLPERAIFWPGDAALIVSDLHIGKAATFRAAGVPVPEQTTAGTLARLTQALARTGATQILCLGDFWHAPSGRTAAALQAVANWRAEHAACRILLVRGNHDMRAGDPPPEWHMECVDEPWDYGPFTWRHRPAATPGRYTFAGHVHPAVSLTGPGRQQLTLPCFHFGAEIALLPAFGDFTGTALVRPVAGDRVFVVAGNRVVSV